jgi:hypothetical protein
LKQDLEAMKRKVETEITTITRTLAEDNETHMKRFALLTSTIEDQTRQLNELKNDHAKTKRQLKTTADLTTELEKSRVNTETKQKDIEAVWKEYKSQLLALVRQLEQTTVKSLMELGS